MSAVDAGLAGEYAAIFAYGALAVALGDELNLLARALEAEHRDRRDALLDRYDEHGWVAPAPDAAYDVGRAENAEAAAESLLDVEERLATTWRAGVASPDPVERALCLEMYMAAAGSLARWREPLGLVPTTAWPGRPE
jgi:hypothetical protein